MKTLVAVVLLFVAAFGVTLLIVGRKTAAPVPGESGLEREADASMAVVAELVAAVEESGGTLELDADQLRAVLLAELIGSATGRRLVESARELHVEFSEHQIEAGLILASSEIESSLRTSGGVAVDKLLRILALIPGRETYLGVLGAPAAAEGALALAGEDLELVIGPLRLAPADLGEALGVPDEKVARILRFDVGGLHVESAQILGQRLVLEVR